jgi:uncharacterized protein YndB with AHSA1/START domain
MTDPAETPRPGGHDLVLTRLIDAPRSALYRCWTEPALLERWFAPAPLTTRVISLDVRPGGASDIVMRDPEGAEYPARGVYLEVVENERIVTTDAYLAGWMPSEKPFMTAIISFADEDGGTRYTAIARHWTAEDRKTHEEMGFHEGWGQCANQLAALARSL